MNDQAGASDVIIEIASDETDVEAAIELGNRCRDTVGHLPFVVYEEAAEAGRLLIARSGDEVSGMRCSHCPGQRSA